MLIEKIDFLCSSPSIRECPKQDVPEFAFIGRSNVGKSSLINMLAGRKGLAKISSTPGKTRLINHYKVSSAIHQERGDPSANEVSPSVAKRPIGPKALSASETSPSAEGLSVAKRRTASTWFLVDLPGYGFAKLSKVQREKFEGVIKNYLEKRENLALTFVLIDSRLEPQQIDINFMNWLGDHEISFVILFTKTDKLSKVQLASNLAAYRKSLALYWAELPMILLTSSENRLGREEVFDEIEKILSF